MSARVYGMGVIGGILLSAALNYPLATYLPGLVVAELPQGQASLAWGLIGASVLLILITGAVAARMSGTLDRKGAAAAGAVAGLIAAMWAEIAVGGAAAGVWGSREILAFGLKHTQNDSQFVGMIAEAVASTHLWSYLSVWIAIGAGAGLGALGGAVAGNGGTPATDRPELIPTLSLVGILTTAFNLIVAMTIFNLLGPSVQRAANESGRTISISGEMITAIVFVTNYALLIIWQILGWWSTRRLQTTEPSALRTRIAVTSLIMGTIPFLLVIMPILQGFFVWWFVLCAVISLVFGALTVRSGWEMRRNLLPSVLSPISMGTIALAGALVSGIMASTSYISVIAGSLNLVLLVIPMISTLTLHDAAQAAEAAANVSGGVPILVQANFAMHASLLYFGIGLTVIITLLAVGIGWLTNRLLTVRK